MILDEDFCLQVGFGVSRHALVAGYAAHARRSGAERLRGICDTDSGSADRLLTLDFGRYLMGAGVTPLLHPAIRGSSREFPRSAGSPLFYVEARQYQATNPGALVRRAYDRLWGTWRRLRRLYRFDEAFLVVFCRRGRLVELPIEVDLGGLTIYSASVDLSDTADHPERVSTIRFSAARLRRTFP